MGRITTLSIDDFKRCERAEGHEGSGLYFYTNGLPTLCSRQRRSPRSAAVVAYAPRLSMKNAAAFFPPGASLMMTAAGLCVENYFCVPLSPLTPLSRTRYSLPMKTLLQAGSIWHVPVPPKSDFFLVIARENS